MTFQVLPEQLAVCRLPPNATIPPSVFDLHFCSITRTTEELSIVLPCSNASPAWDIEDGWRGLMIKGPLDFTMVGVIANVSAPLAAAGIPIFVISTFDTDYLLVKEPRLEDTIEILRKAGNDIELPNA